MQKITIIGNVGNNVDRKTTPQGKKITSFPVAVKGKEKAIWYECVIWGDRDLMFGRLLETLRKGSSVCVIGDLMPVETYTNKNGEVVAKLRISPCSINYVQSNAPQTEQKPQQSNEVHQTQYLF
jgi:single-stranded DNA-binding protein